MFHTVSPGKKGGKTNVWPFVLDVNPQCTLQIAVNVMHCIKSRVCLLHVSSDKRAAVKHLFKDMKAFLSL